jgi:hypothetical protein
MDVFSDIKVVKHDNFFASVLNTNNYSTFSPSVQEVSAEVNSGLLEQWNGVLDLLD